MRWIFDGDMSQPAADDLIDTDRSMPAEPSTNLPNRLGVTTVVAVKLGKPIGESVVAIIRWQAQLQLDFGSKGNCVMSD